MNSICSPLNAMNVFRVLCVAVGLVASPLVRADGFSLARSLKHEPHITLRLSDDQVATVGRERRLILSDAQWTTISKYNRKIPKVLGVESLGEPDCSCHISSAMWTATSKVTIWIERLKRDPDGSKMYREIRSKPGLYTANVEGDLFHAGKPVSWPKFQAAVMAMQEGGYVQLSLPPTVPGSLQKRMDALKAKHHFYHRL